MDVVGGVDFPNVPLEVGEVGGENGRCDLAAALGVSRQTIISLENGKYNPSILLAHAIARLFGTQIEDIFLFEEEEA